MTVQALKCGIVQSCLRLSVWNQAWFIDIFAHYNWFSYRENISAQKDTSICLIRVKCFISLSLRSSKPYLGSTSPPLKLIGFCYYNILFIYLCTDLILFLGCHFILSLCHLKDLLSN